MRFVLFDQQGKHFTEENVLKSGKDYYVLWYDAKMKNYLLFVEYLHKKKFTQASVCPILVVDRAEYLQNIEKIKSQSKDEKMRKDVQVMLKRELTTQESLQRSFGADGKASTSETE